MKIITRYVTQLIPALTRRGRKILFGVKVGIASGACYYLSKEGVWRESEHSVKAYEKLSNALQPYIKQVSSQIPIEIPHLPSTERITFISKHYWNKGVMSTFDFVQNIPQNVTRLGCKSMQLLDNPELSKFFASFKSTEATTEVAKAETKSK